MKHIVRFLILFSSVLFIAVIIPFTAQGEIILDFEAIDDFATVDSFYSGGTDSAGNQGPDFGVSFTEGNQAATVFATADSKIMTWLSASWTAMSVETPFNALSFDYETYFNPYGMEYKGIVEIYGGFSGTGNLLFAKDVTESPNWSNSGLLSFSGEGHSVKFINLNVPGAIVIDNIAIQPVPIPATILLLGSGLIGLAGFKSKFRKR